MAKRSLTDKQVAHIHEKFVALSMKGGKRGDKSRLKEALAAKFDVKVATIDRARNGYKSAAA